MPLKIENRDSTCALNQFNIFSPDYGYAYLVLKLRLDSFKQPLVGPDGLLLLLDIIANKALPTDK